MRITSLHSPALLLGCGGLLLLNPQTSWAQGTTAPPAKSAEAPLGTEQAPSEGAAPASAAASTSAATPASAAPSSQSNEPVEPTSAESIVQDPPAIDPYAEAKERVGRAEKLYADGNFDAALIEFKQAYETMLGHPARPYVLFNIGRCEEKLYRYNDAVASYQQYLREAGEDAHDRSTVEAKVELLEGLLGTLNLTITATKGRSLSVYEVWVDGRLIGENEKVLLIPGGSHQIEIRADGFENKIQEVQLPSRAEKSLAFELTPLATEYRGISPVYFWTAGGIALASAVTGGVFGLMAVTESNAVKNKEPAAITADDKSKLDSLALTADIFFISAGVFAVSATVLGFLTDWSDEPGSEQQLPEKSGLRLREVGAVPTTEGGMLVLGGSF